MTTKQIQISTAISEAVPQFPATISDLISELAQAGFEPALAVRSAS